MFFSEENNILSRVSDEEMNILDIPNDHPFKNNSPFFHEQSSDNFDILNENSYYLNDSKDLYDESHNEQSDNLAIPNNFIISNINPFQNNRDYFAQKKDIEKENIQIEGKFFLILILIALETDGITFKFKFKEKKKMFNTENSLLNKKHKRSKKKKEKKVCYNQFKREDLNKIIQESNLPQELKKEIYKPNINKFIEKFKESPHFFEKLRDFNFKDIYTFGKETEELPRQMMKLFPNF